MNPVMIGVVSHAFTDFLVGRISLEDYCEILAGTFEAMDKSAINNPEVAFYKKFCNKWTALAKDHPEIPESSAYRTSKLVHPGAHHTTRLMIIFTRYAFGSHVHHLNYYLDKYELGRIGFLEKLIRQVSNISEDELGCAIIKMAYKRRHQPGNFRGYFLGLIRGDEV
jgi:hypothetical protein